MAKKKVNKKENSEDDSKLYAFLAVLLLIIGFIVAMVLWKKDKYVMFYAKQSLVLFIGFVIAIVLKVVPVVGEVLYTICAIGLTVLWIITWVYALMGKEKKTFLIGDLAEKFDF